MVNWPKQKKSFCKKCKTHTLHSITWQKKAGKASLLAQGKRRYDRKQLGFGGQKKPILHKNAKTTRKVALRLKCSVCGLQHQITLKRAAHFEIGGAKKEAN